MVISKEQFKLECEKRVRSYGLDRDFKKLSLKWTQSSWYHKYSYNFKWLGLPIIQLPQDILAMQEVICEVRPDLIIETGIAHGGSLIFYASILKLLGIAGRVVGIELNLWPHNKKAILDHPLHENIILLEGDSVSRPIIKKYARKGAPYGFGMPGFLSCRRPCFERA